MKAGLSSCLYKVSYKKWLCAVIDKLWRDASLLSSVLLGTMAVMDLGSHISDALIYIYVIYIFP